MTWAKQQALMDTRLILLWHKGTDGSPMAQDQSGISSQTPVLVMWLTDKFHLVVTHDLVKETENGWEGLEGG